MKIKSFVWAALIIGVAFATVGCMTGQSQISGENNGNFGEHTRTPVKDFESLGLVFTETQVTNSSAFGVDSSGQIFTYQALLREAHHLGADAIINVVIDKKTHAATNARQETWYGSALAIRYTETLSETVSVTVTANGTTRETTSIYFNDGARTGGQSFSAPSAPAAEEGSVAARVIRGVRQ